MRFAVVALNASVLVENVGGGMHARLRCVHIDVAEFVGARCHPTRAARITVERKYRVDDVHELYVRNDEGPVDLTMMHPRPYHLRMDVRVCH